MVKKEKQPTKISQRALIKSLHIMDEFACEATRDNDNGEAQKLEKHYNRLFAFINEQFEAKEIQKIEIPFSDTDIEELQDSREVFNWSFRDQNGVLIDVVIRREEEEMWDEPDEIDNER